MAKGYKETVAQARQEDNSAGKKRNLVLTSLESDN